MNWSKELAAARSPAHVVAIANDYFDGARAALAERLPGEALPPQVKDIAELHAAQRRIVDAFMANPIFGLDSQVQDVCAFSIRALARGVELSEKDPAYCLHDCEYRASSFDDRFDL